MSRAKDKKRKARKAQRAKTAKLRHAAIGHEKLRREFRAIIAADWKEITQ